MAVVNYEDTHGHLPPSYLTDEDGRPMHSWRVLILPFIEQRELYEQYDFSEPWNGPNNRKLADRMPTIYALPGYSEKGTPLTNYLAVVGKETIWNPDRKLTHAGIPDGTSNTILLVENVGAKIHWMEPRDLSFDELPLTIGDPMGIGSLYPTPAVAMADGSVQGLSPEIHPDTLRAMLTIDDGHQLRDDEPGVKELPQGRTEPVPGD